MAPRAEASGVERGEGSATSVWVVLGILVIAFFAFNYLESAARYVQSQSARGEWEERVLEAQQRQLELQDEFVYVSSDDYVSQVARSELGLIQPGDDVYVVLPRRMPEESRLQTVSTQNEVRSERSGFMGSNWWRSLFGE